VVRIYVPGSRAGRPFATAPTDSGFSLSVSGSIPANGQITDQINTRGRVLELSGVYLPYGSRLTVQIGGRVLRQVDTTVLGNVFAGDEALREFFHGTLTLKVENLTGAAISARASLLGVAE
jgi:hypothetical protein